MPTSGSRPSTLHRASSTTPATTALRPRFWSCRRIRPLADKLIAEIREVMREVEPRRTYYPRSDEKTDKACHGMSGRSSSSSDKSRALIPDVDPQSAASIFATRFFAGALGEFLACAFRADGTRVHAQCGGVRQRRLRPALWGDHHHRSPDAQGKCGGLRRSDFPPALRRHRRQRVVGDELLLGYTPWGAFPGHTPRTSAAAPAWCTTLSCYSTCRRPSPRFRSVRHRAIIKGELTISPKPVFFVTNKTAETNHSSRARQVSSGSANPRRYPESLRPLCVADNAMAIRVAHIGP